MKSNQLDSSYRTGETSPPFVRLRTRWTKCRMLDSSYQTNEDMPPYRVTTYQTDEVMPAFFFLAKQKEGDPQNIIKEKLYRKKKYGPQSKTKAQRPAQGQAFPPNTTQWGKSAFIQTTQHEGCELLSSTLKPLLSGIIGPNQSAFIKGRRITDSILLAHELCHSLHSGVGHARMCIKIDLQQAFDSLNRTFLSEALHH